MHLPPSTRPLSLLPRATGRRRASAFLAGVAAVGLLLVLTLIAAAPALGQHVPTLSIGAGEDQRVHRLDYALKVVFALREGAYLAGMDIVIQDNQGRELVSEGNAGPWFYADLPPGDYRITARRGGGPPVRAKVTVTGARQKAVYLTW